MASIPRRSPNGGSSVKDLPTGPREPRSTSLGPEDEAVVVAFRRRTPPPLDDRLFALQPSMPHLTRSSLHRRLQRHGISRLPETGGDEPSKKRFKRHPVGYFHIDLAELRTAERKPSLFVAIERTSKFAFVRLEKRAGKAQAARFLKDLIAAAPCRLHPILTDNGIQFCNRKQDVYAFEHIFERACRENGIGCRLTKAKAREPTVKSSA